MNTATQTQSNGKAAHAPDPTLVRELALSLLDEDPNQPRKTFKNLDAFAAELKVHGVLQPITVRPKGKRYMVVFGARRFRSSKLAGLPTIPVLVRELDDAKALELQIVENSQREDIHPLEEADGYLALREKHGFTVDEIAAKVGKPASTIYARLKFCALIPKAREAFFAGTLTAATALLIARIPHADLQKKALDEFVRESWNGEPPSLSQAKDIIRRRFTLRLVDAPFDKTDAKLVAGATPCTACPKRTGNQKELFADLETKDDLCTDPKCFDQKRDAAAAKIIDAAKAKGQEVLPEKKAKGLFAHGSLKYDTGFVDLSAKVYEGGREKTNRALLGKADIPVVLAKDDAGNVRELVDAQAFAMATKKAPPKPSKAELRRKAETESLKRKNERFAAKRAKEIEHIVSNVERRAPGDAFWRAFANAMLLDFGRETERALERRGLMPSEEDRKKVDTDEVARAAIAKMKGAAARGFGIELWLSCGLEEVRQTFAKLYAAAGKKKAAKK